MAGVSKIDKYGLQEQLVTLLYQKGFTVEQTAEELNALLAQRGDDGLSVSRESVRRYKVQLDEENGGEARKILSRHLTESTPNDLETLEEIKEWLLDNFRDQGISLKIRQSLAKDLVDLVGKKLQLATALDPGDKSTVFQLIKNEIGKIETGGMAGKHSFAMFRESPVEFCNVVLKANLTDDMQDVIRSVWDNPITIARSANAVGKTHGAARAAVAWYKIFEDFPGEVQVYTAAAPPEGNLKRLLWGEIGAVQNQFPEMFDGDVCTTMNISRSPRDFITGVTIPTSGTPEHREGRFSGKHAAYLLFIFDEGDSIPTEVFRGALSCVTGGFARILIMFNPRGSRGFAWELEEKGQAHIIELSAFRHPNVITGEDKIPGAVTRNMTVMRIHEWTRALAPTETPDNECFEIPAFLVGSVAVSNSGKEYPPLKGGWRKVVEPAFWYMVLGKYPPKPANQLVAQDWIDKARSRWDAYVAEHGETPPAGTAGSGGYDVAENIDANVCIGRWGGYVSMPTAWTGVDTLVSAGKATAWALENSVGLVVVDSNGLGSTQPPLLMKNGVKAIGVKASEKPTHDCDLGSFYSIRDQLLWDLREWLRTDSGAMLPPESLLTEEILAVEYWVDERGRVRMTGKDAIQDRIRRSPDRLTALMNTFHEPKLCYPEA